MWLVYMLLIILLVLLIKVAIRDINERSVSHSDLLWLTGTLLLGWFWHVNIAVWPYTLGIVVGGFGLFCLGILGAGDTKLLAVLSLGVSPVFMPIMLYSLVFLGGILAVGYLLYGLATDLAKVRQKGIPYAVPISVVGGAFIFLSYIAR